MSSVISFHERPVITRAKCRECGKEVIACVDAQTACDNLFVYALNFEFLIGRTPADDICFTCASHISVNLVPHTLLKFNNVKYVRHPIMGGGCFHECRVVAWDGAEARVTNSWTQFLPYWFEEFGTLALETMYYNVMGGMSFEQAWKRAELKAKQAYDDAHGILPDDHIAALREFLRELQDMDTDDSE